MFKKNYFTTDYFIEGEYFRSKTNNEYFRIIDKNEYMKNSQQITHFFPSSNLSSHPHFKNYDPEKHVIIRLEFNKNKNYFVESNQAITVKNPDITILNNTSIDELIVNTPKFINLPNY